MVCESELGTQNNIHRKLVFAAYMLWYLGFPCHNTIQLSLCPALMYVKKKKMTSFAQAQYIT